MINLYINLDKFFLNKSFHINNKIFLILFVSGLIAQDKITNVGLTTGSHGWGINIQKLNRYNENIFWSIDGRIYIITGIGDIPIPNNFDFQQERNQKSLLMVPISLGIQHFPFQGKIANNFFPFIHAKTGPLFVFDGDESIDGFFDRWKKAETQITYGFQIGLGVKFVVPPYSFMSIMFGYDVFPLSKKADGRKNYDGGVLQLDFSVKIDD